MMSQSFQKVLIKADIIVEDLKDTHINCEHLLLSLIKYDDAVSQFLQPYGVTYDAVKERVMMLRQRKQIA
jgi:ATP-dependent Clp protease ATP-binding subunit ClpA